MQVIEREGKKYRVPGNLTRFQEDMYVHLINWKWAHITEEAGSYTRKDKTGTPRTETYDAILPESVQGSLPTIYPPVRDELKQYQDKVGFRVHQHFHHMASSQAANLNLFLPLLLHTKADEIFGHLKPDLSSIATAEFYRGFCLEFSGANSGQPTGPLGDQSARSGTDADIAIAYLNHGGELCLWLIEHKLTEGDFTHCGGAKSKGRNQSHDCQRSFAEILQNKDYCYYHSGRQFEYWNLTEEFLDLYPDHLKHDVCPFKGGLNQLWRNHLLARAIEKQGKFKKAFFSVVRHPENVSLERSINTYRKLTGDRATFSELDFRRLVDAALLTKDESMKAWADWYTNLYMV